MKDPHCPFLNKPCIEQACMLWTHVTMMNPQSGTQEDKWTCSLAMLPLMVIETARQTRNVQASVDSMRNEVVKRQDALNAAVQVGVNREAKSIAVDDSRRITYDGECSSDEGG